jgi:hypothetical protein
VTFEVLLIRKEGFYSSFNQNLIKKQIKQVTLTVISSITPAGMGVSS